MKPSIILITFVLLFQSFCVSNTHSGHNNTGTTKVWSTTLDSLQGTWHLEDEAASKIIISGHLWDEYNSATSEHRYFSFYFSDTLITEDDYTNVSLDENATAGKYIVKVAAVSNTVWCFQIYNVSGNSTGATFSIALTESPNTKVFYTKE